MAISRRELTRLIAGAGAFAAVTQLGRSASVAQTTNGFRAMVGVFLYGGCDGWNLVVPTDGRYAAYANARGPSLALAQSSLIPLGGAPFGLHPSLAPLQAVWNDGGMGVVLNTGSLVQPMTQALYNARPDLRPLNLMSHADEQAHWQGMRMQQPNADGFMGRIADRATPTATPSLMSITQSDIALIGAQSSPLVLPSTGPIQRNDVNWGDPTTNALRVAALNAFAGSANLGSITQLTGAQMSSAYAQAGAANAVISASTATVDNYFTDPTTGQPLTSDIAMQLLRVARMIQAHQTLGHSKQTFFVGQQSHDTHVSQVTDVTTGAGRQGDLMGDLAPALAGFYNAMKAIGLSQNVTTFTMSDFGRVYQANDQQGSDHAWGNNHLVIGGALKAKTVHGAYPNQTLGGPDDARTDGRWIPSIAIEEYIGAIAQWYGVAPADMPYVFPNWSTWNGGGRGPVPLFG